MIDITKVEIWNEHIYFKKVYVTGKYNIPPSRHDKGIELGRIINSYDKSHIGKIVVYDPFMARVVNYGDTDVYSVNKDVVEGIYQDEPGEVVDGYAPEEGEK